MYYVVYDRAEPALQDWMNLSIVLGPRVADLLRLARTQIRDGHRDEAQQDGQDDEHTR
jgi:hypothetical protein